MSLDTAALVAALTILLSQRTEVRNLVYRDTTVNLDGYHFINCTFERCKLTYQTADFALTSCRMLQSSVHHPPAGVKAIKLFSASPDVNHQMAIFAPARNADGSISIAD